MNSWKRANSREAAALPRSLRAGENSPPPKDALGGREIVLQILVPAVDKFLTSEDRFATDLEATRAMVALERFRVRTGAYPRDARRVDARGPSCNSHRRVVRRTAPLPSRG